MILFDTNVVIDARDASQANHMWAVRLLEEAVAGEGGGINAATLAELCAGSPKPADIEPGIRKLGLEIFDVPAAASEICGAAYRQYVGSRRASGGGIAPKVPLPDFFIGAHAEIMRWKLATRDAERVSRYFPKVHLLTPKNNK
ncbi:MAG TPA: PIN domain-containing protein [Verrucomicrobiae bacterium]|nr:PIN domain-containing protein [Verrucomicrobiae bacterium]